MAVTVLFGAGHLLSAAALAWLGASLGWGASRWAAVEAWRGDAAAWVLIAAGLVYAVVGTRRAFRRRADGRTAGGDSRVERPAGRSSWMLFAALLLGPCEPLVPLLMAPLARGDRFGAALAAATFGSATLATMCAAVWVSVSAARRAPGDWRRYGPALAGAGVAFCGAAVLVRGL
jgi:hypothetical protein